MLVLVDLFGYLAVVCRAGILVFQSLLLGGTLFISWIALPAPEFAGATIASVRESCLRWLRFSAIGFVAIEALSLYISSAVLISTTGLGWRDLIGANYFLAGSCALIAAVLAYFVSRADGPVRSFTLPLLVAIILFGSVLTNHAAARLSNRPLLIGITLSHETATGFWIGGLLFLVVALRSAKEGATAWYLASRFSRVAIICVVVLLFSGVAMSLIYIGSWGAALGTSYGVMVMAKFLMLGVLLVLGGTNFLLLRYAAPENGVNRMRRIVEAELGIGITVILTAASLTSQPPAIDLVSSTVSPQMILARIKPTWPRLSYPALNAVNADGNPSDQSETRPTTVHNLDGGFFTYKEVTDAKESEANHHWMGAIVLAMGLLAMLARTGKVKWADFWPLLLIGISVFIFLRADTESWPYGPQGFWTAWLHPEVFQHRLAALACVGFAVFEVRVRTHPMRDGAAAMIFPLMCAIGGALLLTHSHSITNVREEMLAELSHVPMGVIAVLAGWSRWLEIRLSPKDRRVVSWIWPICFVAIGLGLLNYREM